MKSLGVDPTQVARLPVYRPVRLHVFVRVAGSRNGNGLPVSRRQRNGSVRTIHDEKGTARTIPYKGTARDNNTIPNKSLYIRPSPLPFPFFYFCTVSAQLFCISH